MHKGMNRVLVPKALDIKKVNELIVDRFNQGLLPKEDLVDPAEQQEFDILAELGDQLDYLNPNKFEELVAEVIAITE